MIHKLLCDDCKNAKKLALNNDKNHSIAQKKARRLRTGLFILKQNQLN
jgi:uncharacterized protein YlaI